MKIKDAEYYATHRDEPAPTLALSNAASEIIRAKAAATPPPAPPPPAPPPPAPPPPAPPPPVVTGRIDVAAYSSESSGDAGLVSIVNDVNAGGGFTIKDVVYYLDLHPEARRGAYAGQVQDKINQQIGAANALTGMLKAGAYQKLGYIPQGADIKVDGDKISYLTTEQHDIQAKREQAQKDLSKYIDPKTKGIDLNAAVAAGISANVIRLAGYDISGAKYDEVKTNLADYQAQVDAQRQALRDLAKKYPDLPSAIRDGQIETVRKAGYDPLDIAKAQSFAADNMLVDGKWLPIAWVKGTPQEKFDYLVKEGTIPKGATFSGIDKQGNVTYTETQEILLTINEPKMVSSPSLLKAIWQSLIHPPLDTQESLKQLHEEQKKTPLILRLLTGHDLIIKNPSSGMYNRIPTWMAFMPAGSASAPGKVVTKQALKTIEINWTKLIPERQAPKVNWDEIYRMIRTGKIKTTEELATKIATSTQGLTERGLTVEHWKEMAQSAIRNAQQEAYDKGVAVWAASQRAKSLAEIQGGITGGLSKARLDKLVGEWTALKATRMFPVVISSNLAAPALVSNPSQMTSLLTKMTPSQATKVLAQISNTIKPVKLNQTLTVSQIKQLEAVQTAVYTQVITQQARQTANKWAQQGKTETQIEQAVQTQLKQQIKAITDPSVKEAVQQKAAQAVKSIPAESVKIKAVVKEVVSPKPAPVKAPAPASAKPPTKEPTKPKIPIRLPFPEGAKGEAEKRAVIKQSKGALAFRMGQLQGKDVWHVIKYPYKSQDDHLVVIGRKPQGASVMRGVRSAYRTAQRLYGKTPSKKLTLDIGFQDVIISPLGAKGVSLGFKPDIRLETKSDITVGKRAKIFPLPKR